MISAFLPMTLFWFQFGSERILIETFVVGVT